MYLLTTHIPVYVDSGRTLTDASWQRDVLLARDWLAPPFGPLTLLCPSMPLQTVDAITVQLVPIGEQDCVRVIPSFDLRCRARQFWVRQRRQWLTDVQRELRSARVLHCSASGVFRPLWYMAHMAGVAERATTVLVGPDMDPYLTRERNLKGRLVCAVFDHIMKRAARCADLVLLKEGAVYARYAGHAHNGKLFCHSMHSLEDVIQVDQLERRLKALSAHRPLKAVYAGRFVQRKGMRDSIDAIARANGKGVRVEYHLFGSGPEEAAMRRQAADLGITDLLHFHGFVEYGPLLIRTLSEYDLLLFMPTEEDTPRMLYDSMAAGLPLLGTRIPFLEHRVETDKIGILVNMGGSDLAAEELCRFDADRRQLLALSRAAMVAGRRHSIEQWYQRRAEWTQEAAQRRICVAAVP